MVKRKREPASNPTDRLKQEIRDHISNSQKLLHRALKATKGFTRQKLGKRLKNAKAKGSEGIEDVKRINREIEAWKSLDISKIVEDYLYRTICKVKRMVESEALPEEVREKGMKKEGDGEEGSTEEKLAKMNVRSGMFNTPNVKQVMADQMRGLYMVMRIPTPEKNPQGKGAKKGKAEDAPLKGILKAQSKTTARTEEMEPESDLEAGDLSEDEDDRGLRSARVADTSDEESLESEGEGPSTIRNSKDRPAVNEDDDPPSDSGSFSKYDALLGSSNSDPDSEDEDDISSPKPFKHNPTHKAPSLSLSPSPPPTKRPKSKIKPPSTKGTTFLPSLLGGYFSGSESSGSDLEDDAAPVVKKNRSGQRARRAIWEKKFGTGANHIKSGQGSVSRDEGWDAKRGADSGRGRGRGRGGFGGTSGRATGENAITPGAEVKRSAKGKDDLGVLHPSWQAAKKAKEEKKTAKFEGKKVVFD
jgi:hypothetical protein